ncbi:MAG: hypothetical protein RMK20_07010 [Verrucomicrobiales bacterium]|nr:hypothetical protein [Verrucomicrobiales bacterium]
MVARLRATHRPDLADPLAECSTRWTIRECQGCRSTVSFLNHCDRFYCPMCQPRLAKLRRQAIEWWAHTIPQPKHVVLTTRNTETITAAHLAAIKSAFARLRRSKFAANWRGGCWALEVTNEGRGWHLHIHALVDAKWIDAGQLAREWAKRVGQDFAIVKVRDCRGTEFLKEVTKYTVKGNDLANWSGSDLAAFVDAFAAGRNFGTFGTLYRRNAEWRQWLAAAEANYTACPCGCTDFRYFTPDEWEWEMIRRETGPPARVPAPINPQLLFAGLP